MLPSSRAALSLNPSVAYLVLNFRASWKKQTTLPALEYAGIPYQSLGERNGAVALMMAWSRSAKARSGPAIAAIFASTSLSSPASPALVPGRASAFNSWARSRIAARSSVVNPLDALPVAVVLLADFGESFFADFFLAIVSADLSGSEVRATTYDLSPNRGVTTLRFCYQQLFDPETPEVEKHSIAAHLQRLVRRRELGHFKLRHRKCHPCW